MDGRFSGRVWTFGDNISTDLMMPGAIIYGAMSGRTSPDETVPFCMSANRPGWYKAVEPGDILVGGCNFGAGSGRPAYVPLRAMGIQAVVAESVGRLFYRNCINGGFLVIGCPGITGLVAEGDRLEIDLAAGVARKAGTDRTVAFPRVPDDSPPMQILRAGGLVPFMKARLGLERTPAS